MVVLPHARPSVAPAQRAEQRWIWSQVWSDVFLFHWRLKPEDVQCRLPTKLEVDVFAGEAWLSLVIFRLSIRPVGFPYLPGVSFFTEVNLRTYVRSGERTGIYFLSIEAHNRLAVRLARLWTPLPYRYAAMKFVKDGDRFQFSRTDAGGKSTNEFQFLPIGLTKRAEKDSRDQWLLERYTAFANRGERVYYGEATHAPWLVQDLEWSAGGSREAAWWPGLPSGPPDAQHYSTSVEALFGPFRDCGDEHLTTQ